MRTPVLIAGVGGASLGTEIIKCLLQFPRYYTIYACDISPLAYGHYVDGLEATFLVDAANYVQEVTEICQQHAIRYILAGAEQPLQLLNNSIDLLKSLDITLASNEPELIRILTDKEATFRHLQELAIPTPSTKRIHREADLVDFPFPCVIKPALDSGGSAFVFLCADAQEAWLYANYLLTHGRIPLAQEYITLDDGGEFTIGVLSLPDGSVFGSIALRRLFPTKLSIASKTSVGLISSGYSQGYIDHFPELCQQAETIASKLGSIGPINIQGRVHDGQLIPFEINPRFSASTYLRALAGFNEINIYLQFLITDSIAPRPEIQPGYYLRTLNERVILQEELKS